MTRETVGAVAARVRAKNAGPFWLTIDLFCDGPDAFARLRAGLATRAVAEAFEVEEASVRRFDIAELAVIKLSLPRPVVQGSTGDRDMHGAAAAALVEGIVLDGV